MQQIAAGWIDALNGANLAALDALLDEAIVDHSGFARLHGAGREGVKRLVTELHRMIPDWRSRIAEVRVKDDLAEIVHIGEGTPPEAFPPELTGRAAAVRPSMRIQMISTIRIKNGRIVEHWAKSFP
jgi:hypothetical protein